MKKYITNNFYFFKVQIKTIGKSCIIQTEKEISAAKCIIKLEKM